MKTASTPLKNFLAANNFAALFASAASQRIDTTALGILATPQFSAEAVVYTASTPGAPLSYVFSCNRDSNNPVKGGYGLAIDAGRNYFFDAYGVSGTYYSAAVGTTLPIGKLTHLCLVGDGAHLMLYVDGALVSSIVMAEALLAPAYAFRIGSLAFTPLYFWDGAIDGVRCYGRALSAQEVAQHARGVYQDESKLVGWWPLDEGSGGTAFDWSGNGNNGTFVNAPTYVQGLTSPRSRTFLIADLYTFTLANGAGVLRYTPFDMNLTIGGSTWLTGGPIIRRDAITMAVGLDVKTMNLEIAPHATDLVNGVPWLMALKRRAFDGCYVLLERTVMPTPGFVGLGKYWKFSGYVADAEADRQLMKVTIRSREEAFNRLFPAAIFQPGCRYTLYDARCSLSKNAFKTSSAVAAGSTVTKINCGLAQAATYFTLGTITFTSGPNANISRTVKSYAPGVITLALALPQVPVVGNTFDAFAGCDKQQATCSGKFNNLVNFSAEPYIPAPETAL